MSVANVLGYSFGQGLLLSIITALIGWFAVSINGSFTKYIWFILPVLSYAISFGLLSAVNNSVCGYVNLSLVATSSLFTFGAVLFFLILSYFSFFQSFIIPIIPTNLQSQFGICCATAFYIFWAGMYGGAFGYGFTQSCP